jgi:hypothetical protein
MSRFLRCGLLAALAALAAPLAEAQPDGSLLTWVDGCEAGAPDLTALLANGAMIVSSDRVLSLFDGTYALDRQPFTIGTNNTGPVFPLCPDARFFGQPQVKLGAFRSAVQVGPDLVLTAWHSPFGSPEGLNVVFGIHDRLVGDVCFSADFDHIQPSQVYTISEVVADGLAGGEGLDFALLRLDRVIGNDYPRVRRSGWGRLGDSATLIGHPERMAAKVDLAGEVGHLTHFQGHQSLQFANLHALAFNSGSMYYNRTQRLVETVGAAGRGVNFVPVGPAPQQDTCYTTVQENGYFSTNASLRHFAAHIPAWELLVDLDPVVHVAAAGTPIHATSSRTVAAPATAASALAYQVVPPASPPSGQPSLTIVPSVPNVGTLPAGQSFTVEETASTPGLPCGIYEPGYQVRDLTNGFDDVARHVFEIGAREFTVSMPSRGIDDIAWPVEETMAYVVTNPRPTPVTVRVSTADDWLTLNGTPGPGFIDVPVGANGGTATVTVGIGPAIQGMKYGSHGARIDFAVAPGSTCPVITQPLSRTFQFIWGSETFEGPGGAIPDGSTSGVPLDLPIDGEAFCIADLDVALRTGGVPPGSPGAPGSQLFFKLRSPEGTEVVLWNHGAGAFAPDLPLNLTFDDEQPPHPYQPLAAVDGEDGGGTWTLTAVDSVPGWLATVERWALVFSACPLP